MMSHAVLDIIGEMDSWQFPLEKLRENADTVPQRAKRCVSTDWTCLSASYIRAEIASISMRTPSWFLIVVATLPSILYTFGPSTTRRSAVLTDILAMSFSHNALSLLKIDSFKTGCVLLSGLFLYDIWWVFGTEVVGATLATPGMNRVHGRVARW